MPRAPQPKYGFLIPLVAFLWRYPRLHVPLVIIGVLVVLFLLFRGCAQLSPPPQYPPASTYPEDRGTEREPKPSVADADVHLLMGNPSGATDDPEKPDNYLMRKPYFALSYNNAKGTPNWVSWCLKEGDLGNAPRPPQFDPDMTLPRSFKHVRSGDYSGSGFDRGHMCPHSDRAGSNEASEATFVMTNIIPQSPASNQKAWADLEDYCRDLVRKKHQTLYVVAGPQGQGGEGKDGPKEVIGRAEKVTVPAKCWKVVLALDDGKGDAGDVGRVNRDSRVFAVVMPNDMTVGHGWAKYRTSAKEVEELTGYHFFDRVPAAVIGPLKEQVDREHIPAERQRKSED
jgi:endonuclease G